VVGRKGVVKWFITDGRDGVADTLGNKDIVDPALATKVRAGFKRRRKCLLPTIQEVAL
jgi:hypothetical protein